MAVHQEGLTQIMATYFGKTVTAPATLYILLVTDVAIAADAALADLTEVTGTGYARQSLTNGAAAVTGAECGSDDWQITLDTVTFTATGTWTTAQQWVLATSADNSGKLIAANVLDDGATTLEDGGSLDVTAVIQGAG